MSNVLRLYEARLPSPSEARLVYRKAKQVSSVTYNLFTIAKKLESEPTGRRACRRRSKCAKACATSSSNSSPPWSRCSARWTSASASTAARCSAQRPTWWTCCSSSMPSEASVEQFPGAVEGEPRQPGRIPLKDKTGTQKPYDALIERRPDLPHIPLTCENTHTALPYIDIVNEILEYYVANGQAGARSRARHRRGHHGRAAGRAAERDPRSLRQAA